MRPCSRSSTRRGRIPRSSGTPAGSCPTRPPTPRPPPRRAGTAPGGAAPRAARDRGGTAPPPLFDTQVAAMVCGCGDSVSYEQLVNDLAKARVDKSSRFTDWSRRPLSEAQLIYALSDVTHLVQVYQQLEAQLQENGRHGWLDEEMAVLTSPDTYRAEPENAWRR